MWEFGNFHISTFPHFQIPHESYQNPLRSALMFVRAACAFVALALGAACTRAPAPPAPPAVASSVLIVTIDTLRADRVGVYGATNVETPNIDRLAAEGVWAPQADVHVPLTRPSHVSLFTGRYPAEHGVRDNISPPLGADVPLLAERFQRAGFATGAFIASAVLDRQSGLARGFDLYSDRFEPGADRKRGDVVAAEAIGWLQGKQKFFAWVHLYDVHAAYVPPGAYAARYAGRPYDGTVAWSDEIVGRLIGALRNAGTLERTLVIVTSDHGEALGEHGEDVHGYFVYEATLRVPLVFRGPGVTPGTTLKGVVRTVDLYPTILDLAGLAPPARASGRSIAPALNGAAMNEESSFAESLVPLLHYGWSDLHAVRDGRWKYILAPKPELYDLESDQDELKNLADTEPARARALRSTLVAQAFPGRRSLGEGGGSAAPGASGLSADALERLGAPGYAVARMELGEAYRDVARYDDAARTIREALAIDPRPAQYWHSLGTVLGANGKVADAERAFSEAVSREPANGLYVYNHGAALYRLDPKEKAAAETHPSAPPGYKKR